MDWTNSDFGEKLNYQQKKQYNPYGFTDEEYILWKSLPELNQLTSLFYGFINLREVKFISMESILTKYR